MAGVLVAADKQKRNTTTAILSSVSYIILGKSVEACTIVVYITFFREKTDDGAPQVGNYPTSFESHNYCNGASNIPLPNWSRAYTCLKTNDTLSSLALFIESRKLTYVCMYVGR